MFLIRLKLMAPPIDTTHIYQNFCYKAVHQLYKCTLKYENKCNKIINSGKDADTKNY